MNGLLTVSKQSMVNVSFSPPELISRGILWARIERGAARHTATLSIEAFIIESIGSGQIVLLGVLVGIVKND